MTRDELYRPNAISKQLRYEEGRLAALSDWLKRLTQELDGLPHEQTYKHSKIEELITQKVDCESSITNLKLIYAECQAELLQKIDAEISNPNQKKILVERYVFGQCFNRIATNLHISERNVYRFHSRGLKSLGLKKVGGD